MTIPREVGQLALDNLESLVAYIQGGEPDLVMQVPAIEALRTALANEFNPDWDQVEALQESLREHMAEIQRLRAALAQPKQEVESDRNHVEDDGCPTEKAVLQRFWREHQMQELEGINDVILNSIRDSSEIVAPPQREWQGLTDEDLSVCDEDGVILARYWEAKLREKNTL